MSMPDGRQPPRKAGLKSKKSSRIQKVCKHLVAKVTSRLRQPEAAMYTSQEEKANLNACTYESLGTTLELRQLHQITIYRGCCFKRMSLATFLHAGICNSASAADEPGTWPSCVQVCHPQQVVLAAKKILQLENKNLRTKDFSLCSEHYVNADRRSFTKST